MYAVPRFTASPVVRTCFAGNSYWVKRDDLLHPTLNGNKARKLAHYLNQPYPGVTTLASYGGAQSNAMLALAALARLRRWRFRYYTRPLPKLLRQTPLGNFKHALALGMQVVETDCLDYTALATSQAPQTLFLRQGIAEPEAELGFRQLAAELGLFARERGLRQLNVFLPSGTGASALYLQKHLGFPVYTTPCVGDEDYLRYQWLSLEPDPSRHPRILPPPRKHPFGRPCLEFWRVWQELRLQTGIEFELLYDPLGWSVLSRYRPRLEGEVLYLHSGGCEGNESMLPRYRHWLRNGGAARAL